MKTSSLPHSSSDADRVSGFVLRTESVKCTMRQISWDELRQHTGSHFNLIHYTITQSSQEINVQCILPILTGDVGPHQLICPCQLYFFFLFCPAGPIPHLTLPGLLSEIVSALTKLGFRAAAELTNPINKGGYQISCYEVYRCLATPLLRLGHQDY